jgi:hypothetical protein
VSARPQVAVHEGAAEQSKPALAAR